MWDSIWKEIVGSGPYALMLACVVAGAVYAIRTLAKWARPQVEHVVETHLRLVESLQQNDVKQTQIMQDQNQILTQHSAILADHSKTLAHHGAVLHEISSKMGQRKNG